MLHGLGDAHLEFGMHLALHPLGWTMLSQALSKDKLKGLQICFHLDGWMCVCKAAVLTRAEHDKPKSRTTVLWEQHPSCAHLIEGDLLVIPVLDVEEHHHPPVLVPAGQDAGVAGLDGAAHGLGAQVVKELGVLQAEIHIACREAGIGKTGCLPGLGKLGELPETGWAGHGEMSVLSLRAVESSACGPRGSGLPQYRSSAADQPQHTWCYPSPCQDLPTPAWCYPSPCQELPTPAFSPTPQ